jgi:hypothetical protein
MKFWESIWQAWESSTIVSGLMALGLLFVVGYLALAGRSIPDAVGIAFGAVIGYFFADKTTKAVVRAVTQNQK